MVGLVVDMVRDAMQLVLHPRRVTVEGQCRMSVTQTSGNGPPINARPK
jgi:hypothetical protein